LEHNNREDSLFAIGTIQMLDSVVIKESKGGVIKTLREGIEMIGGFRLHSGPVLIKPNICTISDHTGHSVSDVKVVEAIVDLLLEKDKMLSIKIVESDSQSKNADEAFKKFGYASMVEAMVEEGYDLRLVNLSKSKTREYAFQGRYFKNPKLPVELIEDHYYISVAVPKTHYLTQLTGSLKNQFGLLPRKDQSTYHPDIDDVIVDINSIVRPNLCIFDARVGVERWNGPKTHQIGLFVIGNNAVSTDAVMARIMGLNPDTISHIGLASSMGLGGLQPEVLCESPEKFVVNFRPPK
jgi:uncharacterized protein (DUF362 family)